ncbi:hypothetical protein GGF41_000990 [Coemansia sp. RSA 2531]|nr:hypothetical protein GGF41_000990 [Coemansia sp. RSA 2531]
MPRHLSPAQALPADVLRLIVKRLVVERRSVHFEAFCRINYLEELLAVCSTWRQVAIEYLWRQLKLTINAITNEVHLERPTWIKNKTLPHNAAHLTKIIHVGVPMSSIVNGVAQKLLVDYIRDSKCFPFVKKLTVEITGLKDQHIDSKESDIANTLEFAKLLKSMTPSAVTVKVICNGKFLPRGYVSTIPDRDWNEEVAILTNVLYSSTKRAHLDLLMVDISHKSTVNFIPLLTSLTLSCVKSPEVGASLLHMSANTLQYLSIDLQDANALICNASGEAVVYSKLQYLKMCGRVVIHSDANSTSSAIALFPVLRIIKLNMTYPFHDDVLFRGNTATLEYLSLKLDYNTVVLLNEKRVFESNNKALQHVSIDEGFKNDDITRVPKSAMNRFLNNLVSATKRLTLLKRSLVRVCITAAQNGQGFSNITEFGVRYINLSVFEMLSTLKVLPSLVNFSGGISDLGPELDNISKDELPDYVASTYCNTGKNLQVWGFNFYSEQTSDQLVNYALLLALACPKLRRIETMVESAGEYHAGISEALERDPYSKYAIRLNRMTNAVHNDM